MPPIVGGLASIQVCNTEKHRLLPSKMLPNCNWKLYQFVFFLRSTRRIEFHMVLYDIIIEYPLEGGACLHATHRNSVHEGILRRGRCVRGGRTPVDRVDDATSLATTSKHQH